METIPAALCTALEANDDGRRLSRLELRELEWHLGCAKDRVRQARQARDGY